LLTLGWGLGEVVCERYEASFGFFDDWGMVVDWWWHIKDGGNASPSMKM